MLCYFCKSSDSFSKTFHLDKNGYVITDTELEAFRILHPYAANTAFQKVTVCGMCVIDRLGKKKVN